MMENPVPSAARLYVPDSAHVALTFLAQLRAAHRQLLVHVEQLEHACGTIPPDRSTLSTLRWRLGQASLARRLLSGRICDYFASRCGPADAEALQAVRAADRALLAMSGSHLGKWTADTIFADWPGYCRDGRAIRQRTLEHVGLEQRILYPLLERAADA
jgi:hypothetical protein